MPAEWLATRYALQGDRDHYCSMHLLGTVPAEITSFDMFYKARRERLEELVGRIVNAAA